MLKVTIIFHMWGQECTTVFDDTSELDWQTWVKTCYEKGFMLPKEVAREDGLILKNDFKNYEEGF